MIQICSRCGQVISETNREKGIAKANAAIARKKLDEAQAVWEAYIKAHPIHAAHSLRMRYPEAGLFLSMGVTIALFAALMWQLPSDVLELLRAFFGSLVIGVLLFFLVCFIPLQRRNAHRIAVHDAFILCHQDEAEILGFKKGSS